MQLMGIVADDDVATGTGATEGRLGGPWFLTVILAIDPVAGYRFCCVPRDSPQRGQIMNHFSTETPLQASDPDTRMTVTATACPPHSVPVKNPSDSSTFMQVCTRFLLCCDNTG